MQRRDREIGLLRQHHQRGVGRHRDRSAAERPDSGNRPEQRRLAGAGGARHQHAFAGADGKSVGCDLRRAVGEMHQEFLQVDPRRRPRKGGSNRSRFQMRGALDRHFEAVETRDDGAPFRQRPVDRDEERQRLLHIAEGFRGLDHGAEQDAVGEIGGRDQHDREDHRGLGIALGEGGEPLGPAHDRVPVADHLAEALEQALALGALAVEQRDLLGILAHPHQAEAEVRLETLLLEIEVDERRADPLRQRGAEDGIDQRAPRPDSRECRRRRRTDAAGPPPTGPTG